MNLKQYFWPRSLLSRTLVLTILSVFIAQAVASLFWYTQSKQREVEGLKAASESMAQVFASTTSFFQSLPAEYRHIALEQLRNMGGARFFVSFNTEEIRIDPIPDTISKREAVDTIQGVMEQKLPNVENILINFSRPETLRVLNNNLLLSDLPKSWAHHTLTLEPLNPPVLVVQIELDTNQWVYIAALLPAPYVTLENDLVNADQLVFLVAITLLLLIFTFTLIRNQTRPLKRLALAANRLSTDIEQPELVEEGASEITTVTRAFNLMQKRMQRYMHDREKLFGSISHDLKTPITRLRLRAELIDNEVQAAKINKDLDELEIMVKGALQTVKDTDIHENVTNIDVLNILKSVAEIHNQQRQLVFIRGAQDLPFSCKPLAFKRCLTNLIDNSVKYGDEVTVYVQDSEKSLDITLIDNGPGIPEEHLKKVFDPYFRLHTDVHGTGLGLGIAKNIIRAHGGEIILSNRQSGGLQIDIAFPKVEQ
ncbi:two-component sensor histidine kinase [Enterovibrio norvegicus]|uniref:ATP-binding protein n=1 Tax=Enterovibrio norvegicus TaxID=188144 RepID=UPI000C830074|nr:ATP-binding protein [Enterovibrio norvegicus]MCC4797159.1 HAMP domain-containing protein [Enterovibrio norvegicus]PMH63989.1 two-component sensor histidine kinase [Enterovibrio norvegicus]PMI35294.1 two-component sensor histidine kinase [Enterovibrio norvegicus]PMN56231.1 two-component sensor histidine kinase [Enterovibrio norvegicus]